jgi:hypothetical protein
MEQKYFIYPFAYEGDLTPGGIPNAVDPNGYVSYSQGWTYDYQRNLQTDSLAKQIQRVTMNEVLFDITTNLQNYQQFGTPEFIDSSDTGGSAFSYGYGAMVRYSSSGTAPFVAYFSAENNNTDVPGSTANWINIGTALAAALNPAPAPHGVVSFATPTNGTWTVPAGVYSIKITCIGGGGPGGMGGGYSGFGGGAGGFAKACVAVTPGQTIGYTVGAGGQPATPLGTQGGTSSMAGVSATGGTSGTMGTASGPAAGDAGEPGTGSVPSGPGGIIITGAYGGSPFYSTTIFQGGNGAAGPMGGGGIGGFGTSDAGSVGISPGSGGGAGAGSGNGAAGAPGIIIVEW